jgi:hypothetical protein
LDGTEAEEIGAVLSVRNGVAARYRLVGDQRVAANYTRPGAEQITNIISKRPGRPLGSSLDERRVNRAVFIASNERHLETNTVALVASISILVGVRTMNPPVLAQESIQTAAIIRPYDKVEIAVVSRNAADMEVDGPAAEQPIGDLCRAKTIVEIRQCRQLRCCIRQF